MINIIINKLCYFNNVNLYLERFIIYYCLRMPNHNTHIQPRKLVGNYSYVLSFDYYY